MRSACALTASTEAKLSRAAKHGDFEQSAEIQRENCPAQSEAGGGDGRVRGGHEGLKHHPPGPGKYDDTDTTLALA